MKELYQRSGLCGALLELVKLLGAYDYNGFAAMSCDTLWSVGVRETKEFAESGLRLVELPDACVRIGVCHILDYLD